MTRPCYMGLTGALVIAVAGLVATAQVIPTKCPKVDAEDHTVQLAHETDCTKFYKCNRGQKILQECPLLDAEGNRLYFNATLQLCDWPENVDCKLPKPVAALQFRAEIPTKCPKHDSKNHTVQLAHESDCTKFYKCDNGHKVLMECPKYNEDGDRLYFNATLQVCDWPANVDCKLPKPVVALQFRAEIPTKCPKHDSKNHTVQLAHESDCTKFYKCDNGHKVLMECPKYNEDGDRLYFNATLQVCDWPANVNCKLPKPVGAIQFRAEIPTNCPKHDSENVTVHLAHESDCTKFYKCSHSQKFVMQCPEYNDDGDRLYFNASSQRCDWPKNVDCQMPEPVPAIQFREQIPTKCPKHDSKNHSVQLAHESDCTKYYACDHGHKIPMDCPAYNAEGDRLYFNASLQVCDWPANVDCKLPKPVAAVQYRAEIPTKCPKHDSENNPVHLAHESDCTKFYTCSHGHKFEMQCPEYNDDGDRLYFNASSQRCDWPENVDCKMPEPVPAIQFREQIPTKCPKHDSKNHTVQLAHESDCTKFYKCNHGQKVLMECPKYNEDGDRLYFNATLQICDWPENVDCKLPKPVAAIPSETTNKDKIPTECPKPGTTNQTVQLAHEKDCTKFYTCNGGHKIESQCPVYNKEGDRLHFNPAIQVCDWPNMVDCKLPLPIAALFSSKVEIPTECPKKDPAEAVQLAHEYDCTKFYKCDRGKKVLMDCPVYNQEGDRLFFNAALQVCDWPENVDCQPSSPGTPGSAPSTETTTNIPSSTPTSSSETPTVIPSSTPISSSETPTDIPPSTPISSSETPTDIPPSTPISSSETPTDIPPSTPISSSETPTDIPFSTPISSSETTTDIPSSTPISSSETTTDIPSSTPSNELPVYPDPDCVGECPDKDPPFPYSFLIPHKNCRFFCLCYKKQGYRYVCPKDGHFSESEKICTDPKEAKCKYGEFAPTKSSNDFIVNENDHASNNILGFNDRFRW